ncbi:MAG: hypothetical protein M5U28_18895, partial [Sandaracinaceae bacterium]|nr:hypothetical protein [Sandaracinaceae bacterium]
RSALLGPRPARAGCARPRVSARAARGRHRAASLPGERRAAPRSAAAPRGVLRLRGRLRPRPRLRAEYVAGLILALGQLACLVLASGGVPEVLCAFPR